MNVHPHKKNGLFKAFAIQAIPFIILGILLPTIGAAQTRFIENKGQWEDHVRFRADVSDGVIFLEDNAITYSFWNKRESGAFHNNRDTDITVHCHAVKMSFEGSHPRPAIEMENPFETFYSYYIGNDSNKWGSGAKAYRKITYYNLYPLIDLIVESSSLGFKYSFIVNPGGNPNNIKMKITGAEDLFIDRGRLHILTTLNPIIEEAPYSYQKWNGHEQEVSTQFNLQDGQNLSFSIGEYNPKFPLVVDPSVIFSSLSGSTADNWGFTATYDQEGNAYTGGTVYNVGGTYPTTFGAFQRFFAGGTGSPNEPRDCGIYKLSEDGRRLIFMTYLGGNGNEQPQSLVVNSKNELIVYGSTESTNFPMVNAFQSLHGGGYDIFLAKFNSNGTRLASSTYLGHSGEDGINGEYVNAVTYRNTANLVYNYGDIYRGEVLVDSNDNIYVASTTESSRFPVTSSAYRSTYAGGGQDAIVVKMSSNLDTMIWGTFIGGNQIDAAYSLDIDAAGDVYVTGGTKSTNFETSTTAYNRNYLGGMADAFVCRLSSDGSSMLSSSLIGTGSYDQGFFIKVGPDDLPYVLGQTAGVGFPIKKTTGSSGVGIFVTKFKRDLSDILLSKKFGANNLVNISPSAFSVDKCGRVYFSGWGGLQANNNATGNTSGLPTTGDAEKRATDGRDFYIAVYTADLATPIYATFWGGNDPNTGSSEHVDGGTSRFDRRGVMYQAICAACDGQQNDPASRFPTFPSNVHGSSSNHVTTTNCNNAVLKIDLEGPAIFAEFERSDISCLVPQTINFTNFTEGSTTFNWEMGDGTTYTDSNVTHTYDKAGSYKVKLIAYNPLACNLRDTQTMLVNIYEKSNAEFGVDIDLCTRKASFRHLGVFAKSFYWEFGDGSVSSGNTTSHTYKSSGKYQVTLFTDLTSDCADTFDLEVVLEDPFNDFRYLLDTCTKTITTDNSSAGFDKTEWDFGDGDTSNRYEPVHFYEESGTYKISLTINKGKSCEETLERDVVIIDPVADFEFDIDTCSTSIAVTNNSKDATSFRWVSSDNHKLISAEPIITFSKGDAFYDISLIAAPFSACADTMTANFRMPGLPIAEFVQEADTCVSAIQFNNRSIDAPSYWWDFGNGDTSRAKHPFYNYRDTGSYLVTLIAYPFSECPDTFEMLVQVDTFRFAEFDIELDTCNLSIKINNTSEDLDSFSYRFGDGTFGSGFEPSHDYSTHGTYNLSMYGLQTRNECRDTFYASVFIPELPIAKYLQSQDSCINTYLFKDTSQFAGRTKWYSDLGDTVLGNNFRAEFPLAGDYQVTMVSFSPYNCRDTLNIDITIDSIPIARFLVQTDSCLGALQFNDNSFGRFRSFWNLDAGVTSQDTSPYNQYTSEGTKTITLVINQGTECEDSLVKTVEVSKYLSDRIDISNIFTPNGDGYNDIWKVLNLRPDCDEYKLSIFNRWGVLIKEVTGDTGFDWDGSNIKEFVLGNDIPVAPGVYFYVLTSDQVKRRGTITLVR